MFRQLLATPVPNYSWTEMFWLIICVVLASTFIGLILDCIKAPYESKKHFQTGGWVMLLISVTLAFLKVSLRIP